MSDVSSFILVFPVIPVVEVPGADLGGNDARMDREPEEVG